MPHHIGQRRRSLLHAYVGHSFHESATSPRWCVAVYLVYVRQLNSVLFGCQRSEHAFNIQRINQRLLVEHKYLLTFSNASNDSS